MRIVGVAIGGSYAAGPIQSEGSVCHWARRCDLVCVYAWFIHRLHIRLISWFWSSAAGFTRFDCSSEGGKRRAKDLCR